MGIGMTIRWSKCCGKWRKVLLIQRGAAPGLGIITHKIAATWYFVVSGFGPFQYSGKHVMEFCRKVTMSIMQPKRARISCFGDLWFSKLRNPNLFLRSHFPCAMCTFVSHICLWRQAADLAWQNSTRLLTDCRSFILCIYVCTFLSHICSVRQAADLA